MRILFFLLISLLSVAGYGQEKPVWDTASTLTVRTFSASSLNRYRSDRQFDYQLTEQPSVNLWDRFWNWFWELMDGIFESGGSRLWMLLAVLSLAAILFASWKTRAMGKSGMFDRSGSQKMAYEVGEETIHDIPFEAALQKAVQEENYRLAIRLLYLKCLKTLNDRQLIHWSRHKTNHDYLLELRNHPLYSTFAGLTHTFEYSWYGNKPVTGETFPDMQQDFQQFEQQL